LVNNCTKRTIIIIIHSIVFHTTHTYNDYNSRTSRTTNARIGDKSIVPPNGGIIPLNKFKYGSHTVAKGVTRA